MSGDALGITDKMEAWPQPLSSSRRHGPGMKELGFVTLTCSFLSSVELAGKNVKVLIVLEKNMTKHKDFCSCAQKIIYKVTIDICQRSLQKMSQDENVGHSLRLWKKLFSETCF